MKRVVVAIGLIFVAGAAATTAGLLVKRNTPGPGGLPSLVRLGGSTTCRMSQLDISYDGSKVFKSTVITGFTVTDTSMLPCTVSGNPLLTFYAGTPDSPSRLHASVGRSRLGTTTAQHPATIVLGPNSARHSAAFVITSTDLAEANCEQVTQIGVGLYPHGVRSMVRLRHPANACGNPPRISISDFFVSRRIRSYL